jgi:hypothetical protein
MTVLLAPIAINLDGSAFLAALEESRRGSIVAADPAEIIALLTTARKGIGTEGERSLLSAMIAMRQGAAAQLELADAAIAMIVGCS